MAYKVIDVSEFQKTIDWKKVKNSGIHAAIIRFGDGDYLDPTFDKNMKGAIAAGLHVGCYIFSRAKTAEAAEKDAKRLYKAASIYKTDMPLYIDLEAKGLEKYADTVAAAFIRKMDVLGGRPGVYANLNWWNNYLTKTLKNYSDRPLWIAQYYSKLTHKKPQLFGMWQYTSSGHIPGIKTRVDRDKCYIPYWKNSQGEKSAKSSEPAPVAKETRTRKEIIADMKAWAKKIEKDGTFFYVRYNQSIDATKTCPICKKREVGNYHGWNCIGFAFAVWHHGGKVGSKCNCHVIDNGTAEKMLKMSDADALATARNRLGINDIKVIRNGGKKIPDSKLKAGDICMCFIDGNTYKHTIFYMGDEKVADCTSGRNPNIKATANLSSYQKNMPIKIAIRYIGGVKEEKKGYTGTFPSTELKKSNTEVINDTIKWAKWIASDNRFHYGHGKDAHHNGCYFCGTTPASKKKSIKNPEFSYCCNPFVGAAWAHGGCVPSLLSMCRKGKSLDMGNGAGSYKKSKLYDNLGKPAKSKLLPGDVLTGYNNGHVMLYLGDGKIAHAGHEDDNVVNSKSWNSSITITDSFSYDAAFRFNGSVNTTCCIYHGEVSYRVNFLQKFLTWYGIKLEADSIFGDSTLKAVKRFQKEQGISADGIVGPNTIKKMKAVKK